MRIARKLRKCILRNLESSSTRCCWIQTNITHTSEPRQVTLFIAELRRGILLKLGIMNNSELTQIEITGQKLDNLNCYEDNLRDT